MATKMSNVAPGSGDEEQEEDDFAQHLRENINKMLSSKSITKVGLGREVQKIYDAGGPKEMDAMARNSLGRQQNTWRTNMVVLCLFFGVMMGPKGLREYGISGTALGHAADVIGIVTFCMTFLCLVLMAALLVASSYLDDAIDVMWFFVTFATWIYASTIGLLFCALGVCVDIIIEAADSALSNDVPLGTAHLPLIIGPCTVLFAIVIYVKLLKKFIKRLAPRAKAANVTPRPVQG